MNAERLAKVEKACYAAWQLATDAPAAEVTGVSVRVAEDEALFEVVLDKHGDLTCKRLS